MPTLAPDDLMTSDERRRLSKILASGLTCSNYSLTAGGRRRSFENLDIVLADPVKAEEFVALLIGSIKAALDKVSADQLAFIDASGRGPRALLDCRTQLSAAIGLSSVVIRPEKHLHVAQVVGRIEPAGQLLFLCDVHTTGQSMARTLGICAREQAQIAHVIYIYDSMPVQTAGLRALGLNVTALAEAKDLLDLGPEFLTTVQRQELEEEPVVHQTELFELAMAEL